MNIIEIASEPPLDADHPENGVLIPRRNTAFVVKQAIRCLLRNVAKGHQRRFKRKPRTSASPPIPDISLRRAVRLPTC